jgi:hypothetical protein
MQHLVLPKWKEGSVIQSEPVVELLIHDFCLQSNDQLFLFLFLLIEMQLLALTLLDQLVNWVVAFAARSHWHPLRMSQLFVVLDEGISVALLDLRNKPAASQVLVGNFDAHENRRVVNLDADHF